jgi:circadian clock protein KaiC
VTDEQRVVIRRIPTGVPNLDVVLGGGLPEYSLIVLAGGPGTGKTTLAEQVLFANAAPDAPAVYFTVLGEPTIKMIRFQQQFRFFDPTKIGKSIHFVNLSDTVQRLGLKRTVEALSGHVTRLNPSLIIVDSFRTLMVASTGETTRELQFFLQDLSVQLATWRVTSLLVGEYGREDVVGNPAFTVADGIIWLIQDVVHNAVIRKLQVVKMRGQAPIPGLHPFRISNDGIRVFPRLLDVDISDAPALPNRRLGTGLPALDELMGGGVPNGETLLVSGPSGVGKTIFALHFLVEGMNNGEPGVLVSFEETPSEQVRKAHNFGWDLVRYRQENLLDLIFMRPLDLSVEEVLERIEDSVTRLNARRVVINSVDGFELAVAPAEREEFREAFYRLIRGLTRRDITVYMTTEVPEKLGELQFSFFNVSFLTDNILLLRYVEIESRLTLALAVVKMRTSPHSRELREFSVGPRGVEIGGGFPNYTGVLSGFPTQSSLALLGMRLNEDERRIVQALLERGESTAEQVASLLHLDLESVRAVLAGLSRRRYVAEIVEPDRVSYHAVLPDVENSRRPRS